MDDNKLFKNIDFIKLINEKEYYNKLIERQLREVNDLNKDIILNEREVNLIDNLIINNIDLMKESEDEDYIYYNENKEDELNNIINLEDELNEEDKEKFKILNLSKDFKKFEFFKNLFFKISKEANIFKYKLSTQHNDNENLLIIDNNLNLNSQLNDSQDLFINSKVPSQKRHCDLNLKTTTNKYYKVCDQINYIKTNKECLIYNK